MDFPGRVIFPPAVESFVNPSVPLRARFTARKIEKETAGQPRARVNETTIGLITEDVRPEVLNDGPNRCCHAGEQQVVVPGSFRGRIPEDGGGKRGKRWESEKKKGGGGGPGGRTEGRGKVKRKKEGRTGRKERKEERKTKEQEKEK